jgi:8-oxo-dGTP diphosphatase
MDKILANIILYDGNNRVLLQHRTSDAPTYQNEYAIFGGSIEEGEDPVEAVKRECLEELEYTLDDPKLFIDITCNSRYGGKRHKYVYIEKYDKRKKPVLHEGKGTKWISSKDLNNVQIVDHDLIVLKEYFGINQPSS